MNCPSCGGILGRELLGKMHGLVCGLVCGMAVIGGRTCKCSDVEGLWRANLLRGGVGALAGESRGITRPVYHFTGEGEIQ
jgi:hypothetical protein